ncbi:MAG TPA: VPDSG-CTERM sorting domain-containing protein [Candidatus Sulfotelmatobacter sp.]|nr:VPDSG-CTERM sorting domain-containing protein [Candidatus Sulfotelmatobacter sp.]
MKKKWLIIAAVAAVVCGIGGIAQAVPDPISGNITFAGGVELNTSSAGTATEVLAWTGTGGSGMPVVISADGSFAGTVGDTATFTQPWFFNSGTVTPLWSVGGFTFDLTSSHIIFQSGSPAVVAVNGIGAVMGNGESPEAMSWSFSTSDPGAGGSGGTLIFSFQSADATMGSGGGAVPDGGTTAMLLGLGILALGLAKKQILA